MFSFGSNNGYYNDVFNEIKRWTPAKKYRSEKGYQEDLYKYLKRNLNSSRGGMFYSETRNMSVRMEAGRNLCDIAVEQHVGIELKKDLNTKAKNDRLIGQVSRYLGDYREGVIIVLVGETNESKVDDLKYALRPLKNGSKYVDIITVINNPKKQNSQPKQSNGFGSSFTGWI
ncbi:hypothetical protein M2325_000719 [Methanococcus voltae PS]|uniref:Uncharacterized protein n=1 Tax=Methanococcus voltae PS TaxID=523842 RepID=A0ABT2EVP8_METVO|nr:hypothetical protein [Methanococcus voltae]MCS3922034.1 hypothetical protein [Methanococcus voltae PS]